MMVNRFSTIAAAMIAVAVQAPAGAVTITFDALAPTFATFGPDYEELDFRFSNTNGGAGAFLNWGISGQNPDPTGKSLGNNFSNTTTTVTRIDGATFDLISIDLADIFNNPVGGDVQFTFTTAGGSSTQTVTLLNQSGFQNFMFNRTGLTSFAYLPLTTTGPWIQVDNLVLAEGTGVIPEPASWAMLIAGFGLTGAAMRRRRAAVAA
jgi:hypothetical protein